MKILDNINHTVREDLQDTMQKGSRVSIAAACFSIYAYQELKKQLEEIAELRFIFTSPTFVQENTPKERREFYIPKLTREKSLYGTEFEVRLRNELTQKALAKECADWVRRKVKFRSNVSGEQMLKMIDSSDEEIVLDFFSGSATTAHAVMKLNATDGIRRKFIMVQLPEPCDEKSEAYKAGYKNICEIGKERIRRAGEKIKQEDDCWKCVPLNRMDGSKPGDDTTAKIVKTIDAGDGKPPIEMVDISKNPDVGFRVFKLDDTNMKDVYYSADEYSQTNLEELESNIKEDRTDLDLLFGCLLDWGLPLSMPYRSEKIGNCTVHTYAPGDAALNVPDALIACFDSNVPENVIKEIAKRKPRRAVFRDSSFASSPEKINVFEIFKLYAPDTDVKVI